MLLGGLAELLHEGQRRRRTPASVLRQCGDGKGWSEDLRITDRTRARQELLRERIGVVDCPPPDEHLRFVGERHDSEVARTVHPLPRDQLLGGLEEFLPVPEIEEQPQCLALAPHHWARDPTTLAKGDSGSIDLESLRWPFAQPQVLAEVDVSADGLLAEAELEARAQGLTEIVEAADVAEQAARAPAELKGHDGQVLQAQPLGESQGLR